MTYYSLPSNLRFIRMLRHLTQQEMSLQLHICRQTYNHYETGRRFPDPETLQKISLFLNISSDYLLTGNPAFLNITYSEVQDFLNTSPFLTPDIQQIILDITSQQEDNNS